MSPSHTKCCSSKGEANCSVNEAKAGNQGIRERANIKGEWYSKPTPEENEHPKHIYRGARLLNFFGCVASKLGKTVNHASGLAGGGKLFVTLLQDRVPGLQPLKTSFHARSKGDEKWHAGREHRF
jgi:hypothetical protein